MGWIAVAAIGLVSPAFADIFEGREALESFQPSAVTIGVDEVVELGCQVGVAVVMVSPDCCLLDRSVHLADLPIGQGMLDFGEPVLDPIFVIPDVEHVGHPRGCGPISLSWRESELDAMSGQNGVDLVWHGCDQGDEES